jgi:AcrR family transcriptional regulator
MLDSRTVHLLATRAGHLDEDSGHPADAGDAIAGGSARTQAERPEAVVTAGTGGADTGSPSGELAGSGRAPQAETEGTRPAPAPPRLPTGTVLGVAEGVARRSVADRMNLATEEVTRLLTATFAVIERTGSTEVSLRAIIRESGLSNQTFYRHFSTKDDLLVTLVAHSWQRRAEDLRDRVDAAPDPAAGVAAWVRGMLRPAADPAAAARTRPFLVALPRLTASHPDPLRRSREALTRPLLTVLPPGPDARANATATYDVVFAALTRYVLTDSYPSEAEMTGLIRYVTRAVGVTSHSARRPLTTSAYRLL